MAVKPTIGHLEGAAGVAGISKIVKMLEHHQVPPNLHLEYLNPNVDLSRFPKHIPNFLIDWSRLGVRRADISSFCFVVLTLIQTWNMRRAIQRNWSAMHWCGFGKILLTKIGRLRICRQRRLLALRRRARLRRSLRLRRVFKLRL